MNARKTYIAAEPDQAQVTVYYDAVGKAHFSREDALAATVKVDVEAALRAALVPAIEDEPDRRRYAAGLVIRAMKANPKLFAALLGYDDAT